MSSKAYNTRLGLLGGLGIIIFGLLWLRLGFLQILRAADLTQVAHSQHLLTVEIPPKRGAIYDRRGHLLAQTLPVDSLYAVARRVTDKQRVARQVAEILRVDPQLLAERLSRDKAFVWLGRHVTVEQAQAVRALNIKALGFIKEYRRFYPGGVLASQILGYAGIDNVGLEGLELVYDRYVRGTPGQRRTVRDGRGRELWGLALRTVPPADGHDVTLTIDVVLQQIAEAALEAAYKKYHALGATIVVMDPQTGDILAMASRPTYDPNVFQRAEPAQRRMRAVTDMMEPGSIFKMVTACALLEERLIQPEERVYCEDGEYRVPGGHIIHDVHEYGWLTFREVIEFSSNIGTSKAAQRLGPERLYAYIRRFGFGTPTGIELRGEIGGMIRPVAQWSKLSPHIIPFGQEVAVTPLQMTRAMAVVANGGLLVQPRLLKSIRDGRGRAMVEPSRTQPARVISAETARLMRDILAGAVERGTGQSAAVDGYRAGGKTGTAQKLEPNGQYSHSKFIGSFVGFVPVEQPQLVIGVFIDEPHPVYYGGVVAAPVFRHVAEAGLRYLNIPLEHPPIEARPAEPAPLSVADGPLA